MILGIETSADLCSVAFCEEDRTLIGYRSEQPMQHARLLASFVDAGRRFLAGDYGKRKYTLSDLELVAVSTGPGSFTGLRIGLSYAQGLCYGRDIPIIGISNHQVLAQQHLYSAENVITLIDARRDEVYVAEYELVDRRYNVIKNYRLVHKDKLAGELPERAQIIIHNKIDLKSEILNSIAAKSSIVFTGAGYSAETIARLGAEKFKRQGADHLHEIEPMYIRPFAGVL